MATYKLIHGNSLEKLKDLDDIEVGKAGVHLVCFDLIMNGYVAFVSDEGLPYDILAEINGKLTKIQVKTTRFVRKVPQRKKETPAYLFHLKRCGKGGRKNYNNTDFDIMALVALDKQIVGYIKIEKFKQTVHLNEENFRKLTLETIL